MKQYLLDLKKAMLLLNTPIYSIPKFERIYPFTNENLAECFPNLEIKDQDCLTVAGSADQVFDMHLNGAKTVDCFDIDPLTIHYFYLKKAAIEAGLSREDFLYFLNSYNFIDAPKYAFSNTTFQKIKKFLPTDSYKVWDTLFANYSSEQLRGGHLFSREKISKDVLRTTVKYLSEDGYLELQKNISKVNPKFYPKNIIDLPDVLTKKYKLIYLSNIIQYVDGIFANQNNSTQLENQIYKLQKFKELLNAFEKNLQEDGEIMAGYIYAINIENNQNAIFNKEAR